MVRVSACPGRSLGTSPSFSTNVSACGHPGTGPFAKVQYRVLIMVHSPFGAAVVWTLPSGLLPWAACSAISPSSNLVKSNIERDGPPIAAGGRIFYGNIDSSVAMWVTALDYIV